MKLENAIELVLKVTKRHAADEQVASGGLVHQEDEVLEAANVVEDFFVNNVFDGTEDDLIITQGDKKLKEMLED